MAVVELSELSRVVSTDAPDSNKASASGSFKSAEDTKEVCVDPADPAKTVRVGTALTDK